MVQSGTNTCYTKEEAFWIFARNWDYTINRNRGEIFSGASILNIMGQLVIAILIGMVWRAAIGVPHEAIAGTNFASKKLLRFGIILLGMRLNLVDIAEGRAESIGHCSGGYYIHDFRCIWTNESI